MKKSMKQENDLTQALDQADRLINQGEFGDAIDGLEILHKTHPEEEPVLLRLAWAHWDNGNKDRAVQYWEILFDRELQRKIFTGFAYDELVRIYKQENAWEKLIATCEKALRVQPDDAGLLEEMGNAYLRAGCSENACGIFEKLTTLEADNPSYCCRLGEALLSAGKFDAALEAYEQAGRLDPDEADRYLFQAAGRLAGQNEFSAARRLLTRCLGLAPANGLYHSFMGDLLVALNEIPEAFACYENACLCHPAHTAAYWNRMGNALMKARAFSEAANAYQKALSSDASTPCRQKLQDALRAAGRPPMETPSLQEPFSSRRSKCGESPEK